MFLILPDAIAVQLSGDSQRLSVVYSDRTLTVWDISNPKKSGLLRSFLAHCACVSCSILVTFSLGTS